MYCTSRDGMYRFVDSNLQVSCTSSISASDRVLLDENLFSVNETDYINLIFASKLDVIKENIVEMSDGTIIKVAQEKVDLLLNWFLLI